VARILARSLLARRLCSDVARLEGAFVYPEGATAVAAARRLRERSWLAPDDRVLYRARTRRGDNVCKNIGVDALACRGVCGLAD
jgi:hypothetical protein